MDINSLKAEDLPESVLWDAYNKAVVILTTQGVQECFDSMLDAGVLRKDAKLSSEEAADIAQELLYEDSCYPSMYDEAGPKLLKRFGTGEATAVDDVSEAVDRLSPETLMAAYKKQKLLLLTDDIKRFYGEVAEFDEDLSRKEPSEKDFLNIAEKYSDKEEVKCMVQEAREEKFHSLLREWAKEGD